MQQHVRPHNSTLRTLTIRMILSASPVATKPVGKEYANVWIGCGPKQQQQQF
jgi:hypothetical protein